MTFRHGPAAVSGAASWSLVDLSPPLGVRFRALLWLHLLKCRGAGDRHGRLRGRALGLTGCSAEDRLDGSGGGRRRRCPSYYLAEGARSGRLPYDLPSRFGTRGSPVDPHISPMTLDAAIMLRFTVIHRSRSLCRFQ